MSTIRVDRITPYQSGSVAIEGLNITNLTIDGTLTASLQQGYVWVGNSSGRTTAVSTGSFVGGGGTINTGSFATTGSNSFIGNQQISGSLSVSGSLTISGSTTQVGNQRITGSVNISGSTTQVGDMILTGSLTISGSSTFRNIGPTILSGSLDISGSINSDGYELAASSTSTIPALNSTFNLDLSGSGEYGGDNYIKKSLVLGDGKVLVAGRFQSIGGHTTNDIARLNSNGTIDTSFTSPIFSHGDFGDYYGYINTFVTQSDGKIIVGGDFDQVSGSNRRGLARLDTNGTLDTSFVTQSWGSFGEVRDIVIQNDGKIVVVGYFTSGSRRINTDGTLDTSYNVSTGSNQPSYFNNDYFHSVALLTSGAQQAILIGGSFAQWGSFSDYTNIVKLNPDGRLDFGFAGTNLDIDWNGGGWSTGDKIKKIKVGDDGYIYIAGRFKDTLAGPNVRNAGFARLTTTDEGDGIGAFDSAFRTYISGSDQNLSGVSVYVNDFDFYDGNKILLGGNFITFGIPGYSTTSANRFAIVSQTTGNLISGWAASGSASTYNLNTGSVNSVTLLPNNNVLVGGTFTSASSPQTAREGLASLKLTGFGNVTTTSDYSITADTNQLLISSSNTYFSGDITASTISGSFVGDGSGLTNLVLSSGVVSGSSQLTSSLDSRYLNVSGEGTISGSFTGSFVGDGSGLTGIPGVTPIQTGSFATTGSNTFKGEQIISSSLIVTNVIKGTGSIFLQPDINDSRDFRIYNTAPSDIHIKGNAAYSFFGDDTNYLKIDDNTGITSIVGVNGVFVSGSLNASGSNTFVGNQTISGSVRVSGSISQKGIGTGNIVIGDDPITNLTSDAQNNTVIGADAGALLTSGSNNVFIGKMAGLLNQDANSNVFIGSTAGYSAKSSQNVYIGESAGFSNISGQYNVAIGHQAGYNNKVNLNTFVGWQSGFANTSGSGNTFVGERSGESNTIGNNNSFFGGSSGRETVAGNNNTFIGLNAGQQNTSGSQNTFVGTEAGSYTTTGNNNTFMGASAGTLNTTGYSNAFFGDNSGLNNTTAYENTFVGSFSGYENRTGAENTFVGTSAGQNNGVGNDNTYIGHRAGNSNISGSNNTLVGKSAGFANTIGNRNTLLGTEAGEVATSGDDNLMLGYKAGAITNNVQNLTNSNTSIFLGSNARGVNNASNQIVIGALAEGNGSNTVTIGNTDITSTTLRGSVSASLFSGSFVGDGSGLTGITSTLPSNILSSSVTNFTDYSQSVDTRISSIVTGTGFATTGSNTFVGNQIVTGSLTLSSSAAVELRVIGDSVLSGSLTVTGSITVPGSGSLVNFVANPSTMRSIRGNGAGLFNIVEQSDGNMTFTVSKIGTRDLTGAITSNISGSTITGSFSDNTTTTSGNGVGARLRGFISGGVVTSIQIDTSNSSFGYEEEGQPANRQGIGYKAGDTVTINQSLNQVTGSLTITLRPQDIDTYFGVHNGFSFDYKNYSRMVVGGGIVTSGSISVGEGVNTLGSINSIAIGTDVNVPSNYSIAVGRDLYNDDNTAYANATFGMHHSSSNYAQTIVGIGSRLDDTGEGAFVVGNGTTEFGTSPLTRSNLLVAQGSKVQVTGSLDVSGNGYVILSKVSASYNYADDTAALAGGVPLGGLYHTSGSVKIRLV